MYVCECIVLKDPIKEGFANAIVCVVEEREKEKGLRKTSFLYIFFLSSKFQPLEMILSGEAINSSTGYYLVISYSVSLSSLCHFTDVWHMPENVSR